jgi:hypothetical protein
MMISMVFLTVDNKVVFEDEDAKQSISAAARKVQHQPL